MTLGPGAVAFAMAYSDSLFLLLAAGAFLAAEQRRWLAMAVLLGLACLTRAQGLLLAIPLAILIADSNGGWRSAASWRTPRMAWLLAAPVGFGLFAAHLGATFGQPFGMFSAQQAWSNIGRPETGDTTAVVSRFDPLVLVLIGMLSMYFFLLAFLRRDRIAAPYRVHAWLSIISTFGLMFFNASLLQSIARYMAVVWPFDWVLADAEGNEACVTTWQGRD